VEPSPPQAEQSEMSKNSAASAATKLVEAIKFDKTDATEHQSECTARKTRTLQHQSCKGDGGGDEQQVAAEPASQPLRRSARKRVPSHKFRDSGC